MRILAHIHSFDDADVIDATLAAVLAQTRPVDHVLLVDNGSTDATLDRRFPAAVEVLRHASNLGTSGAVHTGLRHALEHGYDWAWLFDADTSPHPDALERLLAFYRELPALVRERTWLVASLPRDLATGMPHGGTRFDARGSHALAPPPGGDVYEIDASIWSGSLYKLAAVAQVGLPDLNYVLDLGELEYGLRGKRAGWKAFMHPGSRVDHNVGGQPSMHPSPRRLGPVTLPLFELPPIRCYYLVRNLVFFWFRAYEPRRPCVLLRKAARIVALVLNFGVRPVARRAELVACLRGLRDGAAGRLERRY